jgi:hypothetical protein
MVHELTSLRDLTRGYVLNFDASPHGAVGNTIHPFNCPHICQMQVPPRKIWADSVAELEAWLLAQRASLDPKSPICKFVDA